jgi:tetratricopeptide (TPR) repeat protein
MGLACIALKKFNTADEMLSEALTYRRGLFEDDPSDAHAAMLYGVALSHMGQLEQAKGNADKARAYMTDARDHLVEVDRVWPGISFIEIELAEAVDRLKALA